MPGSSANIGPGFDCLAVAVSRHVWAANYGEGDPCVPTHIARVAYEKAGGVGSIWFGHNLEPGRGLGFSAAARAAGVAIALQESGVSLSDSRQKIFELVTDLEGHGDNAAASVYGGFNIVRGLNAYQMNIDEPDKLLLWVASDQSSTKKSRGKISSTVDISDAVFNISNVALLIASLYEKKFSQLRDATEDRFHQSLRFDASPDSKLAYEAALQLGADAAWLSGAGPSVAMIVKSELVESVMAGLPDSGKAMLVEVDKNGVKQG